MAGPWMIYGANGYTGRLIAQEALERGHKPILAGRSRDAVEQMATALGLEWRAFGLQDEVALACAIRGIDLVVHCAGPFVHTSAPMVRACLRTKAHYVDITGEIPVFQNTFAHDEQARSSGVALLSGAGFDVVPSDCLARHVASRCPEASRLGIFIAGGERTSAGTTRSIIEFLPTGGLARRAGKLMPHPLGHGGKTVRFHDRERHVIPIPWGDLETAYRSTGIGDITTYMALPPGADVLLRLFGGSLQRALRSDRFRNAAARLAGDLARPPDAGERRTGRSHFYARAKNARGHTVEAWLEAPEAYGLTAATAVRSAERILAMQPKGALTPSMAFGADFILDIPGVRRYDELPGGGPGTTEDEEA